MLKEGLLEPLLQQIIVEERKAAEMNVSFLRYCWVCANPYESLKAESRCCQKSECRMMLAEIDTILMLCLPWRTCVAMAVWDGKGRKHQFSTHRGRAFDELLSS
jgi:hypothetical protein